LILPIVRTAIVGLRRDRAALALSFILPISFFSIFAVVFGGNRNSTPKVSLVVVDNDHSQVSQDLIRGLNREGSLSIRTALPAKNNTARVDYTAATAEAAVKAGDVSVALIIPHGFSANPISFGSTGARGAEIELLNDASDQIAPQIVTGLLQKAAMTSMPAVMAEQGMKYTEKYIGDFTPEQRKRMKENLNDLQQIVNRREAAGSSSANSASAGFEGVVPVQERSVVGENKNGNMISFYAAAIGVMFLLFTASGSAGSLLDEAESGTIDRVLSSRVDMTGLLAGKLVFNTLLAFTQLTVMFVFAWAVFKVDFFGHIPGFVVMGICTSLAVAAFGMLLASVCHTRAQLGALSTLLILTMSAIGGSMFPRYFMSPAMQKAGLWTINAWAIDGFTKVFWRDESVSALGPQVSVLLGAAVVLFMMARRFARRWEYA
jgi:ABC-2 type transport system permease protein